MMKFRISTKKLFLTYSQCDLKLTEAIEIVRIKFVPNNIKTYVLVKEQHVLNPSLNDKEVGKHIHVFLESEKKLNITDASKLDMIDKEEVPYYVNYQSVRDKLSIIRYMLKSVTNTETEDFLALKDIGVLIKKNGILETYEKVMVELSEHGRIQDAMGLLKRYNIRKYYSSHMSIEKSLRSLYLKSQGVISSLNFKSFQVLEKFLQELKKHKNFTKIVFLKGESDTGKSSFIFYFGAYISEN